MAPTLSLPVAYAQISHTIKASTSSDTTTNAVFGSCAVVIGVLTVWQGRRLWKLWHVGPHGSQDSRGDQAHHLSEQVPSAPPSHEAHPTPQRLEDVGNISPVENNPTLSGGQTTRPDGTNMESCPEEDGPATTASPHPSVEAGSRIPVDEVSNPADLAIDDTDATSNDHPRAHSTDQGSPPSHQAMQSPKRGPLGRRYSAPGATN